jgi:hypothetical protein
LKKVEAASVMHEILIACDGSLAVTSVSLDYGYSSAICKTVEGYRIRIRCDLDLKSRRVIQPILDKHNLNIDVMKGTVVIY